MFHSTDCIVLLPYKQTNMLRAWLLACPLHTTDTLHLNDVRKCSVFRVSNLYVNKYIYKRYNMTHTFFNKKTLTSYAAPQWLVVEHAQAYKKKIEKFYLQIFPRFYFRVVLFLNYNHFSCLYKLHYSPRIHKELP